MPRQLANAPHGHLSPPWISPQPHAGLRVYAVLVAVSRGYPPVTGRSHTCYSPVRRSPSGALLLPRRREHCCSHAAPRLACVRPVASVHPEPGSNSPLLLCFVSFFFFLCPTRAAFVRRQAGERILAARGFRAFFIRFASLFKESTWTRRRPCPLAQHRGRPQRYALVSVISSRSIISMDSSSVPPRRAGLQR